MKMSFLISQDDAESSVTHAQAYDHGAAKYPGVSKRQEKERSWNKHIKNTDHINSPHPAFSCLALFWYKFINSHEKALEIPSPTFVILDGRISPVSAHTRVLVHEMGKPFVVPPCLKTRNYSRDATLTKQAARPKGLCDFRPFQSFQEPGTIIAALLNRPGAWQHVVQCRKFVTFVFPQMLQTNLGIV